MSTQDPTERATDAANNPATDPATDPVTDPATDPATEAAIEEQAEQAADTSPEEAVEAVAETFDEAEAPPPDDVYNGPDGPEASSDGAVEGQSDSDDGESDEQVAHEQDDETPAAKKTTKKKSKSTRKKVSKPAADDPDQPHDEPSDERSEDSDDGEADEASPKKKTSKKTAKKAASKKATTKKAPPKKPAQPSRMIVNYVPGEECRIAQMEDGQLEEFHAERMDAISRVNNIYVGKVVNVESGIQAAFVDFGIGESGFLHVTDLHPRYFPGADDDDSERVGRKTPRRERPPIQQALKRGQEIIVQVLKEGVGTKGPTLTSYLSIPGRYLVMMPQMDQVGVSRKVEDDQTRKEMRKILDGLDLPDEFGFILRTAGIGKTKTELKRDLAYLQRLWKDLDKRHRSGRAPRLLYSESDLLLRSLRDHLTSDVDEIIIDNEHALQRASKFLKIAAPRSSVKLHRYSGPAPVFEAFGIEEQLELMQSREVPLKSGGRLVIDQTEAVVAIDVNSGKMRSAKDSETNALTTNLEAVDEICRQLRLRDMGGIVINDLIDMRHARNRKAVETRFKERLKRDRARSSVAPISAFGILEMTRQRMRGSLHSQVFTDCPTCHGRGAVKRPSSVASESIRHLASILSHDKVDRVELVVGPRVSGELLSKKRKALARLEHATGKQVIVHVKEMAEPDRTIVYAYGPQGQDIDVDRLPKHAKPDQWLEVWEDTTADDDADWSDLGEAEEIIEEVVDPLAAEDDETEDETAGKKKRRRRRRRGKKKDGEALAQPDGTTEESTEADATSDDGASDPTDAPEDSTEASDGEDAPKKKKRRRRRRGKKKDGDTSSEIDASENAEDGDPVDAASGDNEAEGSDPSAGADEDADDAPKKKKRRRRRRGKMSDADSGSESTGEASAGGTPEPKPSGQAEPVPEPVAKEVKPKRRTLYGAGRRKLSAAEVAQAAKRKD